MSTVPCNTSDIYPTLLEITGVTMEKQPPLDGISLVPLIEGKMKTRPKAMGFWYYPAKGIPTPSKPWMSELLQAQKEGREVADSSRLRLDAAKISKQYPENSFPGHAAWLDWPWKLHHIQNETGEIMWELYNLTDDPYETKDLVNGNNERLKYMRTDLHKWLLSVVQSLNGKDY
jgi:arylsulfatase A-like enzyme